MTTNRMRFKKIIVSDYHGGAIQKMKSLGFKWLYCVPRPTCDSIEFFCCETQQKFKYLPKEIRSVGFNYEHCFTGLSDAQILICKSWGDE